MARAANCGGRLAAALLATAHLALAGDIGFLNGKATQSATESQAPTPLVPQPNDTITAGYWITVDAALAAAAVSTSRLATLNDAAPTQPPLPWEQIVHASRPATVVDSPAALGSLNNWEQATPLPPEAMRAASVGQHNAADNVQRTVSVVPYDMEIGANVLYSLSQHNTPEPVPSQELVNQMFVAQCPMVMFSDQIRVHGPRCSSSMGDWTDPLGNRTVMRWSNNGGSLSFGVDSVVTGSGSVNFATLQESFSMSSWFFELRNCMGMMRYNIEEQIIRAEHVSVRGRSSAVAHDESHNGHTILYRYIIRHPNGTTAAKTETFRMGQDMINISVAPGDNEATGAVVASAARVGHWARSEWRECEGAPRGWALSFPLAARELEAGSTVQDLRVASAVLITLMAFRDEQAGDDGFQHVGQGAMYYSVVRTAGLLFLALIVIAVVLNVVTKKGIDKKLRRFFFRLEHVLLPHRPVKVREPVLNPAY